MITDLSGPAGLAVQEVPEPAVKAGQTIVRVAAGGLNFADFMTAKGGYPGTPPPPLIAGREFSGVEQTKEETTGRRVMGYAQWAAFAEKTAAYSNMLWPVPNHWTHEQAAAFPVNYFTAYLAYWQAGITPGAVWGQPTPAVGGSWLRDFGPCAARRHSAADPDRKPAWRGNVRHFVLRRKTRPRKATRPATRHQLQAT